MKQTLVIENGDAKAVSLVFGLRRAPLAGADLMLSDLQPFPRGRRGLIVAWNEMAAPAGRIVLELDVGDERAVVVQKTFAAASADVQPLLESATPADLEERLAPLLQGQPTKRAAILEWRDTRAIGDRADDIRFFNRLERQTEADEVDVWHAIKGLSDERRRRALADNGVLAHLRVGLRKRQRGATHPYGQGSGSAQGQTIVEDLESLTQIFVDCADHYGKDPAGASGLAMLRFATGNLTLLRREDLPAPPEALDWMAKACQPNSGMHFYFAELADACLSANVRPEFWEPLYPALVLSLELFWKTYRQSELAPLPIGLPVARMAPFEPAVGAMGLPDALERFEQRYASRARDVHRRFVQWYLAPLV